MRQVVSISLTKEEARELKRLVKKRGASSVSSFIKSLVASDQDSMSEAELLRRVKVARADYKKGKSIKAKSMAELL